MVMPLMSGTKFFVAEHLDGFFIGGRKLLPRGEGREHLGFCARFELRRDRLEDEHAGVLCVPEIAGGGEGNPGGFVVAGKVVAELNLAVHGADDGEAHSGDDDSFTMVGLLAEQLLAHARARKITRRRSSSSSELIQRPSDGTSLRISPYSGQTPRTGAVPAMRFPYAIPGRCTVSKQAWRTNVAVF